MMSVIVYEVVKHFSIAIDGYLPIDMDKADFANEYDLRDSPIAIEDVQTPVIRPNATLCRGQHTIRHDTDESKDPIAIVRVCKSGWIFVRIGNVELHINDGSYSASRVDESERSRL